MSNRIRLFMENAFQEFEKMDDLLHFTKNYSIIHAAGGMVINEQEEILLIYRNDRWDLPKGKIEPKESDEIAAIREVKEETGITQIVQCQPFEITYHTYRLNECDILKKTKWFIMQSVGANNLKPQLEEGISEVKWISIDSIHNYIKNSYPLIQYLFDQYGILKLRKNEK